MRKAASLAARATAGAIGIISALACLVQLRMIHLFHLVVRPLARVAGWAWRLTIVVVALHRRVGGLERISSELRSVVGHRAVADLAGHTAYMTDVVH